MKRFFAILTLLAFVATASAQEWRLVWSEEFDYEGLPDPDKWSYDTRGNATGWGNNEKQFYTSENSANAYVKDGILTITALKEPVEGKEYTSARLITRGKGEWLYGRFEIRAKNPTGRGTWPAIWMMPAANTYGGWPASGEIDIMENVGFDPDTIVGAAHTRAYNHSIGTEKSARIHVPTNYTDFHVYALEWEPEEYRLYVDGEHFFTFRNEGTGFAEWPYDKPFYLILNLAIGGNWGGQQGIDDTLFPHRFEIDYVRVYERVR